MRRHSKQVNLDDLARHWRCDSAHNLGSSSQAQPLARHSLPELMSVSLQPYSYHLEHMLTSQSSHLELLWCQSAHGHDTQIYGAVIMPTVMVVNAYCRLQGNSFMTMPTVVSGRKESKKKTSPTVPHPKGATWCLWRWCVLALRPRLENAW